MRSRACTHDRRTRQTQAVEEEARPATASSHRRQLNRADHHGTPKQRTHGALPSFLGCRQVRGRPGCGDSAKAKSTPQPVPNFTNCGKNGQAKKPVIGPQVEGRRLKRVPFTVSRLTEFCSRKELVNQTGYEFRDWPLVIIKELIDNSLDSAEEVGVAPSILVEISGDVIAVTDNGPGIPASIIEQVLNYAIRVSSREAYVSPTRGAQGNALKTILPMGYVLSEHLGEDASGETIIEAHGVAHHIRFSVDHIKQEPKIAHTTETSSLPSGTRIRAKLPKPKVYEYENENYFDDLIADSRDSIIRLVESYAWINPHLTLQLIWNGENVIDIKASNPDWKKWLPTWPTSPHWYDLGRFRRYMAAHISNRPSITVREFISEFDGMTSTAKQKLVLAETGASHMSLHNYFGLHKANIENIAKLLASLKAHSKPVK